MNLTLKSTDVTVELDDLRLAAALAHSAPDADLELTGSGRRWLVSYGRIDATVDPCGFRQLVLTTMHGGRVGLLPASDGVSFTGALRDIGGGLYERTGPDGTERRIGTFLAAEHVEALLAALPDRAGEIVTDVTAHLAADVELGVVVVTLSAEHPALDHRLDVIAHRVAALLLVEELLIAAERESAA